MRTLEKKYKQVNEEITKSRQAQKGKYKEIYVMMTKPLELI